MGVLVEDHLFKLRGLLGYAAGRYLYPAVIYRASPGGAPGYVPEPLPSIKQRLHPSLGPEVKVTPDLYIRLFKEKPDEVACNGVLAAVEFHKKPAAIPCAHRLFRCPLALCPGKLPFKLKVTRVEVERLAQEFRRARDIPPCVPLPSDIPVDALEVNPCVRVVLDSLASLRRGFPSA